MSGTNVVIDSHCDSLWHWLTVINLWRAMSGTNVVNFFGKIRSLKEEEKKGIDYLHNTETMRLKIAW